MNDFQENNEQLEETESSGVSRASIWPGIVIVALILVAGLAIVYAHSQRAQTNAITTRDASLNASVTQLQDQLQSTTTKLNEMVAQQQAAAQAAAEAVQARQRAAAEHHSAGASRNAAHRRHVLTASEKRYNALAARVDAQQKELDQTNQSVAQTRSDLQANLDSTAAGLNGSIAKNHSELVALEKRGQRNFFEFDLSKEKEFSHAGPISLSLRHADTKHQRYNLMMLVDDNRLEKKNVDLYEPIWISSSDAPQPVEIVVNKITKNHIHGYVSAPKFSNAELNGSDATLQPVAATSSNSNATEAAPAGSAQVPQAAPGSAQPTQPVSTPSVQP